MSESSSKHPRERKRVSMKAPTTKLQHPEKLQASTSKWNPDVQRRLFGVWLLELLWRLDVGVWNFSEKAHA
jgi:hypothetical protein